MTVFEESASPGAAATAPGEPLLQVRDLCVDFAADSSRISAVDHVSFELAAGEVLAVVGESGCGKSVTAMALTGLLPRTAKVSGSVRLAGSELIGASERTLRGVRGGSIAYIFQEPMTSLNPVFTVGRQIVEALKIHENLSNRPARERAADLLRLVGIPSPVERLRQYPHQLSGGMRQRVMIAMAVACRPRVLVADEPTTALDVTVQVGILDLLRDMRDRLGTAVLLITHDLGVVSDVADRVMVMYAGRVVERAGVYDLLARPLHPYTGGLMAAVPTPSVQPDVGRLKEIPGRVPTLSVQPDACTFADRCDRVLDRCREHRPPLERQWLDRAVACWNPLGGSDSGGDSGAARGSGGDGGADRGSGGAGDADVTGPARTGATT